MEELKDYLPFWGKMTAAEQQSFLTSTRKVRYPKGTILYHGGGECTGVEILISGRTRVFMTSPNGGEITLYRLLEGDSCVLSAACMIKSLNFEAHMEFEEDSQLYVIPQKVFKAVSDTNSAVKDFMLEVVSDRFSDVMWVMQQLVFTNMGKRLADALLEHSALTGSDSLQMTHEVLSRDLGTAREVVSRLLKQFERDGMVQLSRGTIEILDKKRLQGL